MSVRERAIKRARSLIILATFSGPASFVVAAAALCVRSCEFSFLLLRCVVRSFVVGAWLTHFFFANLDVDCDCDAESSLPFVRA